MATQVLTLHQNLPTSGARRVAPFALEGELYLAIPQLAEDVPGQKPHMNAGNSDIDMTIYRWRDGRFEEAERLRVPGGEDAAFFCMSGEPFLATASVRRGSGPYDLNTSSTIFRRQSGAWLEFQAVPTFAAKQWHHFSFGERHFLALAQGVTLPGAEARHPHQSRILEWDGRSFIDFQSLDGCWGYGWSDFVIDGERYLAYADHATASLLFRWNGSRFTPIQTFADRGGRAFLFFEMEGASWLAFASIFGESTLYRWNGSQFTAHQPLGGPGGREFALIRAVSGLYLVRICFVEGTPGAPKTDLQSQIYRWEQGRFVRLEDFPTFGGTDAATFEADGNRYLAVSNSLTADIRFRQDTVIYKLSL
jgi:EPTP domain